MSALAKAAHRPPDIALILGTHKSAPDEGEDDDKGGDDTDHEQAMDDAADSMMEATEKKDAAGFKKALCAFLDLYHAGEDDKGDEDEEDGE